MPYPLLILRIVQHLGYSALRAERDYERNPRLILEMLRVAAYEQAYQEWEAYEAIPLEKRAEQDMTPPKGPMVGLVREHRAILVDQEADRRQQEKGGERLT